MKIRPVALIILIPSLITLFICSIVLSAAAFAAASSVKDSPSGAVALAPDTGASNGSTASNIAGNDIFVVFDEEDYETGAPETHEAALTGGGEYISSEDMTPEVLISNEGIDYESIIRKALTSSRDIRKINLNIKNNENNLLMNEIAYKPNFTVKMDNDRNYSYELSQKVADLVDLSIGKNDNTKKTDSGTLNYSMSIDLRRLDDSDLKLSRLGFNRDLLSYAGARENFKLRVIRQFYELVMAIEEYRVLNNSCQRWYEMLDYARSKYELGLANKIDYLNAEVNLANAQNALLQQEQNIQTLKEQFFDLTGCVEDGGGTNEIPLKYNITFEKMATEEIESILANKDNSCVREDVEAERVALEIARVKYLKAKKQAAPRLSLNLIKTDYDNPARESDFSSSLTYRFNMGRQQNSVNEWIEKNNYELKKIALDEIEKSVSIERRDALRRINFIEKAYEIAAKSLKQAYENYEFSTISFQKGLISNIDLRDAQDKLTSAKRSVVSLIISHKIACRRFYFVMGKDL
jgi:outer membrane protein